MEAEPEVRLRRSVSLALLILYGLGTTVGAGIYALTGKIAGEAGLWAPASFLVACLLAALTGLSFGELASRYPKAAGEAVYLQAGFELRRLAQIGGLLAILAGTTSAATLTRATAGYWTELSGWAALPSTIALVACLGAIAAWGIRESVVLAALLTLVEVGGVLLVAGAGGLHLWTSGGAVSASGGAGIPVLGVLSGAVLGFYAFIGFEDMVNVAEEVDRPRRNLPVGIAITLAITAVLYVSLAAVAVRVVPPAELAVSEAPLTAIYRAAAGPLPDVISAIAVAGMLNGILIQIIKGSRVLYGLACQGAAPVRFAVVSPRTRTPLLATGILTVLVLVCSVFFPLERLARTTSWITLTLFALVDWSLVRIKLQRRAGPARIQVPLWVPWLGAVLSAGLVAQELWIVFS